MTNADIQMSARSVMLAAQAARVKLNLPQRVRRRLVGSLNGAEPTPMLTLTIVSRKHSDTNADTP